LSAPLKSAELAILKVAQVLGLQAHEELLGGAIRFSLQPQEHLRPDGFERILAGPPVPDGFRFGPVRRPDLAVLPGCGETPQEALEITIAMRESIGHLIIGQTG